MLGRLIARIQENTADVRSRPVTIVAFGDSVTMGCMAAGEFDFEHVYHARFRRLLEQRFKGTVFNVINSGVDGDTAAGALSRLERDVAVGDDGRFAGARRGSAVPVRVGPIAIPAAPGLGLGGRGDKRKNGRHGHTGHRGRETHPSHRELLMQM